MATHKQTHIKYKDMDADVDELIAPLILELWKAEIYTTLSCQNNMRKIWIQFMTAGDAEDFLNIVGAKYEQTLGSLYNRIIWNRIPENSRGKLHKYWDFEAFAEDWSLVQKDNGEEEHTEPTEISFSISIRFPKSDLTAVMERMVEHNRKRRMRRSTKSNNS